MNGSISIFSLIFLFSPIIANKYTKDANEPFVDDSEIKDDRNFRTQKLNFAWSKAIRKLSTIEQNELFIELKKLDKQFLAAKYERDGGSDSGGTLMKDVEKQLEKLFKKFRLEDVYDSLVSGAGEKKDDSLSDDRNEPHRGPSSKSVHFKDEKLRRLWLDALSDGGFDREELSALEEEFQHHQRKLDEYGKLSSKRMSSEKKENSVLHEDFDEEKNKNQFNAEMKQKFKNLQSGYDSLKTKVAEKKQENKMKDTESITHPRVIALLEKARSIYSGPELESIEEELRHFQARLKKLEYLEQEAAQNKGEHEPTAKTAKKEKSSKIYDRELADQLSEHSRKVEKYERYLSSKLEL